jgi:hypothetical protein
MTPVQPILVCILLIGVTLYFRRLRSRLADRIVVSLALVSALILVAFPEWANLIAHKIGVGRGVDLIFYLAIPGLALAGLLLVSKVLMLEERICELSRPFALRDAVEPGEIDRRSEAQ